ncbi:glycosyltransferase, exosortase A system-associated [Kineobactrum sediminis]|uniref:Glycosyltransferase, exosortase A system-associated n=1 Tax=Kineobactrum sediminis TaxID=1905677 RepID=A0A2N5XZL1_9GAMM|nr:TIGR04063 family PEP-CTERM/XrtA system glycosyltransferase [Kineobactrum sediminis]PLW81529.1 glycosyltransferase, exosortase A system-associated [Kineobactrum sediminis]
MRILHILDHSIPLHSGYTFRTRNLLRGQRALGWHTAHVTGLKQGSTEHREEKIDGLHFYRTAASTSALFRLPLLNQWDVVRTLARRIEEVAAIEKPDVLHAHSPALNGLAALLAGRKLGLPVVYECRAFWEDAAVDHGTSCEGGARYRLTRALETHVFRQADAVTTICEGLRAEIAGRGIAADKITVIPNAVDTESFTFGAPARADLQQQLGLQGKTVLGFIGSFYAYEGIPLLLQALPGLLSQNPDLRLLLVGGGPQEQAINTAIDELGVAHAVVSTGRVPHNTVQDYYNLVDIFIYPRLAMRLTELVTPLKPLEAMAQGRLVVASDVGGHKELIRHGDTGMLFAAGQPLALAAAVQDLLDRRDSWQAMRDSGRAFVEQERTWAASVSRYPAVYWSLA